VRWLNRLNKVDKITIVSTGNGNSTGMNKLTNDMTQMAAQVPALFEALSGMNMAESVLQSKTDCRQVSSDRRRLRAEHLRGQEITECSNQRSQPDFKSG